jgi:hypothetical protein
VNVRGELGLSASIRAIDASTSSTGETSLVPMRRRISTDASDSNSSDSDMISTLAWLGIHKICQIPLACLEHT